MMTAQNTVTQTPMLTDVVQYLMVAPATVISRGRTTAH